MKCVSAGRGDRQGRALRNERSEWSNEAERRNPEHSDPKRSEGERPVSLKATEDLKFSDNSIIKSSKRLKNLDILKTQK